MITKNTVFVLGAGASIPFGFPSGYQLVQSICEGTKKAKWSNEMCEIRSVGLGLLFNADEIRKFGEELEESGAMSIDSFLEHRSDLRKIGKACIARALIPP